MSPESLTAEEQIELLERLAKRRRLQVRQILLGEIVSELFEGNTKSFYFIVRQGEVFVVVPSGLQGRLYGNEGLDEEASTISGFRSGTRFIFSVLARGLVQAARIEAWLEPVAVSTTAEFFLRRTNMLK